MTRSELKRSSFRDGSIRMTQPHNWQFTNISTAAWPVVLHCEVVHDNFFPT